MIIVGIHNTGVTSSAAVVVDGELAFGCAEERLTRQKYSKYFPHRAIEAGLAHVGAAWDDVDIFAIGWNPAINIGARYRAGRSEWPSHPGERFYSNANHLLPKLKGGAFVATDQIFHRADGSSATILHVNHHLAHCATAFFQSGFDRAAILSCDGYGERATTVWARGNGGDIDVLRETEFPHSIGEFYSTLTEYLGFRPNLDEWKVMGASAYGDPDTHYNALRAMIAFDGDAEFELDLQYFRHFDFDAETMFTDRLVEVLGPPRKRQEPVAHRHFDIAAALQKIVEEYLFAALGWLRAETGEEKLCLTGGVFMNAVANGKIAAAGLFDEVYIPFAPDDSGNSIGAALWAAQRADEPARNSRLPASPYLGRAYHDDEIRDVLQRSQLPHEEPHDMTATVAALIAEGRIVGWFQGRMEFGQRALGARSILADPRAPEMKDRINQAVKFREAFRPFAPAVLHEHAEAYFEGIGGINVPYMEKVFPVRVAMRERIPAVVHEDGGARLQTVNMEATPLFHGLISAFYERTGIPLVLNTSFNLNDEPIVESPADAIRTFHTSGMDALAIGRYLLVK